jgi:hypothetical protein
MITTSGEKPEPLLNRVYADNGEFSHWQLIDPTTGENLWSQNPNEDAAQGYPVKPSGEKQRLTHDQCKDIVVQKHFGKTWTWNSLVGRYLSDVDHLVNEAAELYASQSLPIREKPDFQAMADKYAESCNGGSRGSGIIQQSYKAACERIWKDYVEPIR